jgi:PAS domain S-box-containing protein
VKVRPVSAKKRTGETFDSQGYLIHYPVEHFRENQLVGMAEPLRLLIVEDSLNDTLFIVRELLRGGFQASPERVETAAAMKAALQTNSWDLIISDYALPQFNAVEALAIYKTLGLDIPFIIVSGVIGEDRAVEMVKAGAHDYVMKDNLKRLVPAVRAELRAAQDRRIRRRTERTSAFLASLVESCDDAIIGQTLEGRIVSWNAGAERLFGYAPEEAIGRSMQMLVPAYRPRELAELCEKLAKGAHIEPYETLRVKKNGSLVDVSLAVSPIRDASGRVIGASAVVRDITRRRTEESERLKLIQDLTAALVHNPVHRLTPDTKV